MLLIMMMLIEKGGKVDQLDFAAKVHNWMLHGFEEFGDLGMLCKCVMVKWELNCFCRRYGNWNDC